MEVKFEKSQLRGSERHFLKNSLLPLCFHVTLFLFCTALFVIILIAFSPFGNYSPNLLRWQRIDRSSSEDKFDFGSHKFAVDVFNRLSDSGNVTNILISPISLIVSLSMLLYSSWNSDKFNGFKKSIGWDKLPIEDLRKYLQKMVSGAKQLYVDSIVFVNETSKLDDDYIGTLLKIYKVKLQKTNFRDRNLTNALIAEWLKDHHQPLTSYPLSSPKDKAVLINSVYFKARWTYPFSGKYASEFVNERGEAKNVTMMRLREELFINELGGFKVLRLPYEGDDISLFLMLPEKGRSLHWLRTKLANNLKAFLVDIDKYLNKVKVDVCLPIFTLERSGSLRTLLSRAGLGDLLSGPLGKSGSDRSFVSDLFQESRLVVDQDGTEASSSTVARISDRGSSEAEFFVDRPFLFFLRENRRKILLFVGQFTGPVS